MPNTIQNKEELEEEQVAMVKRFIIGMLGQYGRKWKELTELQQATFEQDIEKLTNGIIHEVCSKSISQAHQSGIEEERKRIEKGFEPFRKDLAGVVQVLNKHNMKNSARELRDDLDYMVHLVAGHREEDCIRLVESLKENTKASKG